MLNKRKDIVAFCCLKKALFLDPFKWEVHANLAKLFMRKNKYLSAQIHLRSALKLKPDPYFYNLLGICFCELEDYGNAEKSFEEGGRMDDEECKINHLCLLLKVGNQEKAKEKYKHLEEQGSYSLNVKEKLIEVKRYL